MDEEVAPGAGGVMGWMDVEHRGGFLGRAGRYGIFGFGRDGVALGHDGIAPGPDSEPG